MFSKVSESLEGRSKWWGAPDLPAGSPYPVVHCADGDDEWDEPLNFLCQIRCEDIAALDPDGLPERDCARLLRDIKKYQATRRSRWKAGASVIIYCCASTRSSVSGA